MNDCSFCRKKIQQGTGKLFVRKNGKLVWFCSSKCEKNLLKLGRNPVKLQWAQKQKKAPAEKI